MIVLSRAELNEERKRVVEEARLAEEALDAELKSAVMNSSPKTYIELINHIRSTARSQNHIYFQILGNHSSYSLACSRRIHEGVFANMLAEELATGRPLGSVYKVVGEYLNRFMKEHGGDLTLIQEGSIWKLSW